MEKTLLYLLNLQKTKSYQFLNPLQTPLLLCLLNPLENLTVLLRFGLALEIKKTKVEVSGCKDVDDLREKIREKLEVKVPVIQIVLKLNGKELKPDEELNLKELQSTQNKEAPLFVEIRQSSETQQGGVGGIVVDANWSVEQVCEWMKGLKLTQDYSSLLTSNGIDGAAALAMTKEDWREAGIKAIGDLSKIMLALNKK